MISDHLQYSQYTAITVTAVGIKNNFCRCVNSWSGDKQHGRLKALFIKDNIKSERYKNDPPCK